MGSISPGVLSFCISLGGVYEIIIYFRNPGRGDKPKDSYGGSAYSFLFGRSTSGKNVNDRTAMQNTLDCLDYVRELRGLGIGMTFEKENIDTLDAEGEVMLTILSSLT